MYTIHRKGNATQDPHQKERKKSLQQKAKDLARTQWNEGWSKESQATAWRLRRITKQANSREGHELYSRIKNTAMAGMLAQLRTGHCGLKYYLWRFKIADNPECNKCGYEKETVEHFLLECPAYRKERWELSKKVGHLG